MSDTRTQAFCSEHHIPRNFGSDESLLADFAEELERDADAASRLLEMLYSDIFEAGPVMKIADRNELRTWVKAYRERSAL